MVEPLFALIQRNHSDTGPIHVALQAFLTRQRQIVTHVRKQEITATYSVQLATRRWLSTGNALSTGSENDQEFDPQIKEFVTYLLDRSAELAGSSPLSYDERRQVAETVRQPLTEGGPVIEESCDYSVPTASGDVRVRIINTSPGKSRPALIYLHGGGWMLFSLETHGRIMRELAAGADIAVIGIEYSLSPEVRYPVQLNESQAVVRWLRENSDKVGVDSSLLAIGGDSAGANLAVVTCLALREVSELSGIQGMLLYYGVYDARFDTDSYERYADPAYNLSRQEMRDFWECYVRTPEDYTDPFVSPLRADLSGLPATHLVIAERDVLHDENIQMAAKLQESGVDVHSEVYDGTIHSFIEAMSMADVSRRAIADSAHWLRTRLNPT